MAVKGYLLSKQAHRKPERKVSSKYIFLILILITSFAIFFLEKTFNIIDQTIYLVQGKNYNPFEDAIQSPLSTNASTSLLENELKNMRSVFPADGLLYYYSGILIQQKVINELLNDESFLLDFAFYHHIAKPNSIIIPLKDEWLTGIIYLRKSISLGIPEPKKEIALKHLAYLYFFGGPAYSGELNRLKKVINIPMDSLFLTLMEAFQGEQLSDWSLMEGRLPENVYHLWKAINGIKSGNRPLAYAELNYMAKHDNVLLKNRALYLFASIAANSGKKRLQLGYYSDMDWEQFLNKNRWFYPELKYLLLFYGKKERVKLLEKSVNKLGY
jgi:hypothetical protein